MGTSLATVASRSCLACLVLGLLVAGCSEPPDDPPVDPCELQPVVEGGAAEVGLGDQFAPIVDGQEVTVELGIQGLWMFVVNGRVRDMDVGRDDLRGVITFAALDANAQEISLEVGCRVRTFVETPDGARQLDTPFQLALLPQATPILDGGMVTLRLEVRDHEGRQAIDARTVVARMPTAAAARER